MLVRGPGHLARAADDKRAAAVALDVRAGLPEKVHERVKVGWPQRALRSRGHSALRRVPLRSRAVCAGRTPFTPRAPPEVGNQGAATATTQCRAARPLRCGRPERRLHHGLCRSSSGCVLNGDSCVAWRTSRACPRTCGHLVQKVSAERRPSSTAAITGGYLSSVL